MITIANRKNFRVRSNHGNTLVELMFAIVIVAISVVALYQMFVQGSQMITEEYHRRNAFENAQAKLELAKAYKAVCDSIPRSLSGTFTEPLAPPEPGQDESIIATYRLLVEHSLERNGQDIPYMSTVTIDYEWAERTGRILNLKLKTLVIH